MGLPFTVDSISSSNGHHVRNFHALIRKTIAVFLSVFIVFTTTTAIAAYDPNHKYFYHGYSFETKEEWTRAYHEVKTLGSINGRPVAPSYIPPLEYRLIKAESHAVVSRLTESEVNSRAFRSSVVPNPNDLGSVMRKRIFAIGGGALLGVAAVQTLLEGIGWIMDPDSQSIWRNKTSDPNEDPNYTYSDSGHQDDKLGSAAAACSTRLSQGLTCTTQTQPWQDNQTWYGCVRSDGSEVNNCVLVLRKPKTAPAEKVYLSDQDLGEAMLGHKTEGNKLPNDTNIPTSVPAAGTPIPEDGSNPFADEAISNAVPETPTDRDDDATTTVTITTKTTLIDPSTGALVTTTVINSTVTNNTTGAQKTGGSNTSTNTTANKTSTSTNADGSTNTTTSNTTVNNSNGTQTTTTTTTNSSTGHSETTITVTPNRSTTTTTTTTTPNPATGQNTSTTSSTTTYSSPTNTTSTSNSTGTSTTSSTSTATNTNTNTDTNTTTTSTTTTNPNTGQQTTSTTSSTTTTPTTTTTTTSTPTPTEAKWPKFCDWAKIVCDHINWTEEAPKDQTPEPVDKEDISSQIPEKPSINFNGQCPAPVNFSFDFPFRTFSWDFEWTNLCDSLIKMKPYVLGISNLMAVFILLNARKEIG